MMVFLLLVKLLINPLKLRLNDQQSYLMKVSSKVYAIITDYQVTSQWFNLTDLQKSLNQKSFFKEPSIFIRSSELKLTRSINLKKLSYFSQDHLIAMSGQLEFRDHCLIGCLLTHNEDLVPRRFLI